MDYNIYETIIILNPKIKDPKKQFKELQEMYKKFSHAHKKKVGYKDLGEKKLAYKIKECETGYYLQFQWVGTSDEVVETERQLRINDAVIKFIGVLGYKVTGKYKEITPKAMQNLLEELKEKKEFHILSTLMLRSMQKAVYDKSNIGHFGLASKCYTHFTSPIRRYPDTTVHRLLRTYLFKKQIDKDTIEYWDNKLVYLTEHCSERERAAQDCEREVDDMKIAEYMEKHIGEEYDGIVSSVVSFGLFVELPNLIEGLIKMDDLKDDRYIFDETTFSLVGQNTKKRYRLGDKLHVKVKAASKEARTVDFELCESKDVNNEEEN